MGLPEVLSPVTAAACSDGVISASVEVPSPMFDTLGLSSMNPPAATPWDDAGDLSLWGRVDEESPGQSEPSVLFSSLRPLTNQAPATANAGPTNVAHWPGKSIRTVNHLTDVIGNCLPIAVIGSLCHLTWTL